MGASIRVRLFAQAREAVGRRELRFPLPQASTGLDRVLDVLQQEYPGLARVLPTCRLALNGSYVKDRTATVRDGDEVGIHPPYSGG